MIIIAKLTFRYATMKSGKSAEAIQIVQNYLYGNKKGCILSPAIDVATSNSIKTRFGGGVEIKARTFLKTTNLFEFVNSILKDENIDFVLVDEANFLTSKQVDQLGDIVDYLNIDVLAYGLTTKFDTELFEGSKRLIEIADRIENTTCRSICSCGRKAIFNARFSNGVLVDIDDASSAIMIDKKDNKKGAIEYVPLCRKCYKELKSHKDKNK